MESGKGIKIIPHGRGNAVRVGFNIVDGKCGLWEGKAHISRR